MKNVFILISTFILANTMGYAQCNPQVTVTEHIYHSPCGHTVCDFYLSSSGTDTISFFTGGGSPFFYAFGVSPRGTSNHLTVDTISVIYWSAGPVSVTGTALDAVSGCTVSFAGPVFNAVIDTPVVQPICLVTVDSTTDKPLIVWEKVNRDATVEYDIYRAKTPDSIFSHVATVLWDSLSAWVDTSAQPDSMSYRYKISYMDTCSNISYLSPYHQTMYLTQLGGGTFTWTPYVIEGDTLPIGTYDFYKDSTCHGDWRLLETVPYTQNTAFDSAYGVYPCANYKVVLTLPNPCNPSRGFTTITSNISTVLPNGISDIMNTEVIKVQPNPVMDQFVITSLMTGSKDLSITNMLGQEVYTTSTKSNSLMITTQDWPSGVYFVAVSSGSTKATVRVVK